MRILIVSTAFLPYPSGVSEHVHHLALGLVKKGHDVKILTTNYPRQWENGHCDHLNVIRFGKAFMLHINKSVSPVQVGLDVPLKVKNFLGKERFDIIHLHACYPPELAFWALHYSKTVNCVTYHTVGFKKKPIYKIPAFIFKSYNKKFHGRIAVSKIAQKWAEPYIPGEYRIIHNGVDTERFSLNIPPIIEKDKNSFIILYVGRLDKRKGALLAIEAFRKINNEFPHARLFMVGKGPLAKDAHELVESLGLEDNVKFFGFVSGRELPRYYAACDVFISPALGGEAQGIVLLEALACGKPIIASDIDGYREFVEDGKTGVFFEQGSADDLARKIRLLLTNDQLRNSLAQNARQTAEKYSWDKIVEEIETYYNELITQT